MSLVSASEAFFENLTVEQEFMTGVDTDKVLFIYLHIVFTKLIYPTKIERSIMIEQHLGNLLLRMLVLD